MVAVNIDTSGKDRAATDALPADTKMISFHIPYTESTKAVIKAAIYRHM
jgi:phosphoglycerate dehydrogenase-like enzyme